VSLFLEPVHCVDDALCHHRSNVVDDL
jgi:hypothetical protein